MTLQTGQQLFPIHIFPISCKGNQSMKFGKLIEYKIINGNIILEIIFLKNHTQNVVAKLNFVKVKY